jgi:hypothetical protein
MRSAFSLGKVLAVVICVLAGVSALPARADDGFAAFWEKFTTALGSDDVNTVKALVKFPVVYDGEERGADAFPTIYDDWFAPDARECLAGTTPVDDGIDYYVAYCDLIYVFVNTEKGWRLEGIDAND